MRAGCSPRALCMCDVVVYVLKMSWLPMESVLRMLGYGSVRLCLWCTRVSCAMLCALAHSRFGGARWMHFLTPARPTSGFHPGTGRWRPRPNALVSVLGSGKVFKT